MYLWKNIVFPETLTTIKSLAFYDIVFNDILDLKNVTAIEDQAFTAVKAHTIIARKLTSATGQLFNNNPNLVSLYLDSLSSWNQKIFMSCPNLKYVYTEKNITHSTQTLGCTNITFVMNCKVNDASEVITTNWKKLSNVTLYVPYESLEYYKQAFGDSATYKNYKILPIGTIANVTNAVTGTTDTFVLMVVNGKYDTLTQTYEQVFEVASILTNNSYIVIPNEWEYVDNGVSKQLKISKFGADALNGQNTIKNLTLPLYMSTYAEESFSNSISLERIYVQDGN